ncbi:MAG: 3-dehydroquinate synthase [Proteobacteria bacterium]|nr:MAG: 3-dehydroquinate synthase [Pseudomonadota bacterium]
MITLQVDLGDRSYPIFIGTGLLDDTSWLREHVGSRQVMVVSNNTVAPLYLEAVENAFGDRAFSKLILRDGEQYKTLDSFDQIISALLEQGFDRSCTLIALGGGVVGDITGYAAACYQRGVDFVQIPTTLLAQVDSSVGGKTAVNHRLGKNMIGAFHQPTRVITDIATLTTLGTRELRAGIAEIIKYGLISDPTLFAWLEANVENLLDLDPQSLTHAVRRSCENKATIVAQDELESGIRALLNLGHTFGHGIENVLGYGTWLHGEAVACGLCMATELSMRMGLINTADHERVVALMRRVGLPDSPPIDADPKELTSAMRRDKKNRAGTIRLVLIRAIGDAFICDDYPSDEFQRVLEGRPGGTGID